VRVDAHRRLAHDLSEVADAQRPGTALLQEPQGGLEEAFDMRFLAAT